VRILLWSEEEIGGRRVEGIDRVLTEVDDEGRILREIGLDTEGRVLHIAPALRGKWRYGIFDLQIIDVATLPPRDAVPREQFEALWAAGAREFGVRPGRTVS
jgi:hypothetical protein